MVNPRLENIPSIGVDRMGDAADAAHDPDILRLENLDTDLPPPKEAILASHQALENDACNSYLPFHGQRPLREAVVRHVGGLSGISYDWESQCVISAGACNGVFNTLLALIQPGDEVILPDPIYVGLLNRVRLAGGAPRLVPLSASASGWRLDLDALEQAVTSKTRVLLMVSPSMPTGGVLSHEEWEAIAEVCRRANLWLLYDAAQERILFAGQKYIHPASLSGMAERTITVGAVTKEYRMIGWRVGWVVGPQKPLADVMRVGISNVVCQVGIAAPGATAALSSSQDGVAEAVAEWQKRRDILLDELSGLPVCAPGGGWCLLVDVQKLGFDCDEASGLLMKKGKIAATPMRNWGSDRASAYVRFVYSNEPVHRLKGVRERVRAAWGT